MSVGGPGLGTLLVQRIDAALGTTLAQQTNLATGARPDAVSQAAEAARLEPLQNPITREPRENVDRALLQNEQQVRQTIERAKLDAQKGLLTPSREGPNTGTTPSAPTTLGNAARTILALLMNFPEQPAPVQGRQPLVSPFPEGGQNQSGNASGPAAGQSAGAGTANTQAPASTAGAQAGGPAANASPTAGNPAGLSGSAPTNPVINMAMAAQRVSAQSFSQALGNAVQSSGLFYESHLGNLAFGKMPAQALRQEPQAQLALATPLRMAQMPGAASPEATTTLASTAANARNEPATSTTTSGTPTTPATPGAATQPNVATSLTGLHPETHLMVRQQLEVLANQTIAWRGEAWPDAPMDWEIQRREPDPEAGHEAQTHWATRLKLHLPHLGEVDVRINLAGQQVLMHVVAPDSAQTLSANADTLRASFDASGLRLNQFVVEQHPESQGRQP